MNHPKYVLIATLKQLCLLFSSRTFSVKKSVLSTLDREYMLGVADTNEPRQFHVRVPCHSRFNRSHHCSSPATIVFRVRRDPLYSLLGIYYFACAQVVCNLKFSSSVYCTCIPEEAVSLSLVYTHTPPQFNEMTVNPMWDQKLKANRLEYAEVLASLCAPISHNLCTVVTRHTVS